MIEGKNLPIYEEIIDEAFKLSKIPTTQFLMEAFPNMSVEEKTKELSTPRVQAHKEGNVSSVHIRFVESETPVAEAIYYPYLAIETFYDTAKSVLQQYYGFEEELLDEHCRKEATNM